MRRKSQQKCRTVDGGGLLLLELLWFTELSVALGVKEMVKARLIDDNRLQN
jgi:hypothetical protein